MDNQTPYIFISYSSKNIAEAEAVRSMLDKNGLQSWMAPYNIPVGAKYAHVIDEAIENCVCVLLLLTQAAQESDHVDREIERALSYKKEILPVRLDHCALNSGFRYYIGNSQIVDVSAVNEANMEMRSVIDRLEQITFRTFDAFLLLFEKAICHWKHVSKAYTIDPERMQLLKDVYNGIVALFKEEGYTDSDYTITMEPDPLGLGDISVAVVCNDLVIHNIAVFCEIIQHLQNFEIYPLADNKLRFAGVFRKVVRVASAQI